MTTRNFDHRNTTPSTSGHPQDWTGSTRRITDTSHTNASATPAELDPPHPPTTTTAPNPTTPPTPASAWASTPGLSEDRKQYLRLYTPRLPEDFWQATRPAVLAAVAATPYVSTGEDRFRLSTLAHYAYWCYRVDGEFTHARHMNDQQFVRYLAHGLDHKKTSSRNTTLSSLRRIRDRSAPKKNRMRRAPVSAPYTPRQWRDLQRTADALTGTVWHERLLAALDLTGEAGLRPDEALKVRGIDLTADRDAVLIDVADERGVLRVVPVFDQTAARLRPLIGTDDFVLWPEHAGRSNAISTIVAQARKQEPAAANFNSARARHTYIARLMRAHLPTRTVAYLAGVNPGTHTLEDIASHITEPTPQDALTDIREARTWKEDHPWS